jgi:hypothetical protein
LCHQYGRRYRIEYGGKGDPATTGHQIATENAERDGPPDTEATFPDLQRIQRVSTWSEVELVIGNHVIEPRADDTERHADHDHQLHTVGSATPGAPATRRDDHCDDDARDDAQRVRPNGQRAKMPDIGTGTRDGQDDVRPGAPHQAVLMGPIISPLSLAIGDLR